MEMAFASIVGLIGQFVVGRQARQQQDFNDFLQWLIQNGHEDIRENIEKITRPLSASMPS